MDTKRQAVIESIEEALSHGDSTAARAILKANMDLFCPQHPAPTRLLLRLINDLHDAEMWSESVPLMEQLIHQTPTPQPSVQLKLAKILYQTCNQPQEALAVLESMPRTLPSAQAKLRDQLTHLLKKAASERAVGNSSTK